MPHLATADMQNAEPAWWQVEGNLAPSAPYRELVRLQRRLSLSVTASNRKRIVTRFEQIKLSRHGSFLLAEMKQLGAELICPRLGH
jgi:hypothetical protein